MAPRIMHKGVNFSGSGGGGSSTFAGLTDVNLTNLQNGQIVKYDSATQKWINANESGGGGGGNYSETTLYTGSTLEDTMTLSHSIEDYDAICVVAGQVDGNNNLRFPHVIPTSSMLDAMTNGYEIGLCSDTSYFYFTVDTTTQISKGSYQNNFFISDVFGITYGASGGGGTGSGNVRFNDENRYIQVYMNGMWINAYLVPYFTMLMFDTSASISKTYTFVEEGDYLLWSSCCVYEPTSTSKVSSTATLISSNSEDGIDQDWTRTCEYYIVHAVPGDTATFTMASYDHSSVGVVNVTGLSLTEVEFDFIVDNGVQLSQTYTSSKDYLALMITIGSSRSLSGYGHTTQSWYEDYNSVDYISNTSSTVTYNAYGYGGGSAAIIIFEAEAGGGGGSTPSSNLTSTYQVIENNERQSTNVDVGFDSYTLISDPNA